MFPTLTQSVVAFSLATLVIVLAGGKLAIMADRLASRTGLGAAFFGVILLAGITSLPDFAATMGAAIDHRPDLAMSNVLGSMAANLSYLGIADIVYRKANLEHAAASAVNLMLAALLIVLLALPLLAIVSPPMAFWGVHPVSPVIVGAYFFGLHLVRKTEKQPMWIPRLTAETARAMPEEEQGRSSAGLVLVFMLMGALTGVAGWVLMMAAEDMADRSGWSENVVGGLLTAMATSTPELVTTIVAVRIGALNLAVGNIFGTNCFNILVVAAADGVYTSGSIYHDIDSLQMTWGLVSILMTAILLLGMVRRETYGIGRIGFESALILLLYLSAAGIVIASS